MKSKAKKEKTIKLSAKIINYAALKIFKRINDSLESNNFEIREINEFLKQAVLKLSDKEIKIANNRVLRIMNEYENILSENFSEELHDRDDYDDNFFPNIDYNYEFYEIWKNGVAKKLTVIMEYDSTTSGLSKRLVDPYKSSAPYGEGYCHTRKEVRKFRFDRVINIKMTDKKFIKPK